MLKKTVTLILSCALLLTGTVQLTAAATFSDSFDAKSVILMEQSTGEVLYEYNADEALPPASVTKIMTVLLVLEALDAGKIKTEDPVTVSAYATSMGGSQIYLKENEVMSVNDLLKAVVVASANDAAVALAEYLCGSEESFVTLMNERAKELGMNNTTFQNTNGLDDSDEGHLTSARDIAIMSREVLKHPKIFEYSTIWMDSVRDGAFGLTNTNRLIRYYNGANGLKTGSTSKAGFCISATAVRDGMQLIAVVMASSTRDTRNALAASLLDWGFANYAVTEFEGKETKPIPVKGGVQDACGAAYPAASFVGEKNSGKIEQKIQCNEFLSAPVKKGDVVGSVVYLRGEEELGKTDILATEDIPRITFGQVLIRLLQKTCFSS